MRNPFLYLFICIALVCSCHKREAQKPAEQFTDEVRLKTTPVQDQGHSELCWIHAMLATIETERLMQGDSLTLSVDYVARMMLQEEARRRYLSKGTTAISLRGTMPMTLHLMERHGAELFASYHARDKVNYGILRGKVEQTTDMMLSRKQGLEQLEKAVGELLDSAIDFMPRFVFMYGAEYTPLEFAHSVWHKDDYVAVTSFDHHPYGQSVVLEIPDNKMSDSFLNVPLDTLMQRIERSIRAGHPVGWEGDVTEPGFSFRQGVARLDSSTSVSMQRLSAEDIVALRQQQFERFLTTDDHCMALVGIGRDRQGRKYYLAKNSWGKKNPYGGFMYLAEDYVKLKTIAVMLKNEEQ